jgi:hypothetical protein
MTKENIVLVILVIGTSQVLVLGRVILEQNKIFWPSEKTSEFLLCVSMSIITTPHYTEPVKCNYIMTYVIKYIGNAAKACEQQCSI